MPSIQEIAAQLGLDDADRATLVSFGKELAENPLAADDKIDWIMKSPKYCEPEYGQQALYQGLLIAAVQQKEDPNGLHPTVPSLASGVREPSDLVDSRPAQANLKNIEAAINTMVAAGTDPDDPAMVEARAKETDLLTEIGETTSLAAAINTRTAAVDEARLEAGIEQEKAVKQEFFERAMASHKRQMTPENVALEMVEQAWQRQLSGY